MKTNLIIFISFLFINCGGSQLFIEARANYGMVGTIDNWSSNNVLSNVPSIDHINVLSPEIGITYRQYLFDGKKIQIKKIVKKQIQKHLKENGKND